MGTAISAVAVGTAVPAVAAGSTVAVGSVVGDTGVPAQPLSTTKTDTSSVMTFIFRNYILSFLIMALAII